MPQSPETQGAKNLRRQMREGRAPLLEAIREAYPPYILPLCHWWTEKWFQSDFSIPEASSYTDISGIARIGETMILIVI